jgi:hypothetical protein
MGGAMSYADKLHEEIDDLTNEIMDEIRVVLRKHEVHFPDWGTLDDYNLDDRIYGSVHDEITKTYSNKTERNK